MSRLRRIGVILAAAALSLVASAASAGKPERVPGELLVKYRAGGIRAQSSVAAARGMTALGVTTAKTYTRIGVKRMRLAAGRDMDQVLAALRADPSVEYAEPNYIIRADAVPDDALFSGLWGLHNTGQTGGHVDADIDAPEAWDVTTGGNVLVGVIDSGIDMAHPDVAANIWVNPGEIAGNGIDDDGNGFVDDVNGWDFVNDDSVPHDDNGHGTHVAGTIGAVGDNGVGVAGVAWQVKLMALKILDGSGDGTTADAVEAVLYASAMGVDLTNSSWGGGGYSQALKDAIAAGPLFMAAAGNDGEDTDVVPHYPSSFDLTNIVSVAASDNEDDIAPFSNYGLETVDLAAPGSSIRSLAPGGGYAYKSGTSMATPHVTGVAALMLAKLGGLTPAQLKARLLDTVDPVARLDGLVATEGRLNAAAAVGLAIVAGPSTIDFGNVLVGSTAVRTVEIRNEGATAANVTGATVASPFSASPQSAALDPGGSAFISVRFEPGVPGAVGDELVISTDHPDAPTIPVSLSGHGTGPPDIAVLPAAISETRPVGTDTTIQVLITNNGTGELTYRIAEAQTATPIEPSAAHVFVPLAKGEEDPREGWIGPDASGGTDGFGYAWRDSDDLLGPLFEWEEVSEVGTSLVPIGDGDDETLGRFPIGFDFPLYGAAFDSLYLSTNGFLSFTSTSTEFANQPLPSSGAPEYLLAVFWDDLVFTPETAAHYHSDGTRLVVELRDVARLSSTGLYTFEAILRPDGSILYQYLSVEGELGSGTIGIQDGDGSTGLTVAFNTEYVKDRLAILITPPEVPWLSADPASNSIAAGETDTVQVALAIPRDQVEDVHAGLAVLSDDPDEPQVMVPVDVEVVVPRVDVDVPTPLDIVLSAGDSTTVSPAVTIGNVGDGVLHVEILSELDSAAGDALVLVTARSVYVDAGSEDGGGSASSGTVEVPEALLPLNVAGKGILFDFDDDESTRHHILMDDLEVAGATVDTLVGPLTAAALGGCDVFVKIEPATGGGPTPEELAALTAFVTEGGGLVIAGDSARDELNEWISFLPGVTYISGAATETTTDITAHPTTAGVGSLYAGYSVARLQVTGDAVSLARWAGQTQIAATSNRGRAIIISDEDIAQDDDIIVADNRLFLANVFSWVSYRGVPWLTVTPDVFPVANGGTRDVAVQFNARDLLATDQLITGEGIHTADLFVVSDDPLEPEVRVPVTLTVTGTPDIDASTVALTLPASVVGQSTEDTLWVLSVGTDLLNVSDMAVDNDEFAFQSLTQPTPFSLAPGDSHPVAVSFSPAATGLRTGILTIASDDPDEGTFGVSLAGTGVEPPALQIVKPPPVLAASLAYGDSLEITDGLTVENTGGDTLRVDVQVQTDSPGTWLSVEEGVLDAVPPGATVSAGVWFRAAVYGGTHEAVVRLLTNVPDAPASASVVEEIPAQLTVVGEADVAVVQDSLQVGAVSLGGTAHATLEVVNTNAATDSLRVASIASSSPAFSAAPTAFALGVDDTQTVEVSFTPVALGVQECTLTILSNDPDEPVLTVVADGKGATPPDVEVSLDSLVYVLSIGDDSTATLTIGNTGEGVLSFEIVEQVAVGIQASGGAESVALPPTGALLPGEHFAGPFSGPRAMAFDASGILHVANAMGSIVKVDQTGAITPYVGGPEGPSGMAFDAAGNLYVSSTDELGVSRIAPDGAITPFVTDLNYPQGLAFDRGGDLYIIDAGMPGDILRVTPAGAVSVFASEIHDASALAFGADGDLLVLTESEVLKVDPSGAATVFASPGGYLDGMALDVNGNVYVGDGSLGTIGVYGPDGSLNEVLTNEVSGYPMCMAFGPVPDGVQNTWLYVANGDERPSPYTDSVARFGVGVAGMPLPAGAGMAWLTQTPFSGFVAAGDQIHVEVLATTANVLGGAYSGDLLIESNDPDQPQITLPVRLTAIGTPEIALDQISLDFGSVLAGDSAGQTLTLSNTGTDMLEVTAMSFSGSEFSVSPSTMSLAVGMSRQVEVTFQPSAGGVSVDDTLTIASNDAGSPTRVALTGQGVHAPSVEVQPASLSESLLPDQTTTLDLTISNTGMLETDLVISEIRVQPVGHAVPTADDVVGAQSRQALVGMEYVADEMLVKFRNTVSAADAQSAMAGIGATTLAVFEPIGVQHVRLPAGTALDQVLATTRANPAVEYAEPNYLLHADAIPSDLHFSELWGLHNTGQTGGLADADVDALEAWDITTGGDVLVGVIDSGIDVAHPELAGNIWTNPGEIAGNGTDDDGNGFVDDVNGWDFVSDDSDPFDDDGHGTHVAGTIGAVGDNDAGMVGVAWEVKLMAVKFLDHTGTGTTADAVEAVLYATAMGADLTNNSWGGGGYSQALKDAIAAGPLFLAAAGNDGEDTDVAPHYPSSYDLPNIVSVAATDDEDDLATFSNYGLVTVDLGAPGQSIWSLAPGGGYTSMSGTSMATPHVTGAAALLLSTSSGLSPTQVKARLLETVDPLVSLEGLAVTGGRLNAFGALEEAVNWLVLGTSSGVVPGGSSLTLPVRFDSQGLASDTTYSANIVIMSNDPDSPVLVVEAHLGVGEASLVGQVMSDGSPVVGATVQVWADYPADVSPAAEATTDGAGRYALQVDPGTYDLRAHAPGYVPEVIEQTAAPSSDVDFSLAGIAEVAGPTSEYVFFYSTSSYYRGAPLKVGDVVTATDPDGVLCGVFTATADSSYGAMAVYADDSSTGELDEGADPLDVIRFELNGFAADVLSGTPVWTSNGDEHEVDVGTGTAVVSIPLVAGFNLVSWSVDTANDSIEVIASPVADNLIQVLGFEAAALNPNGPVPGGKLYNPALQPFTNTLKVTDHRLGYWFRMSAPGVLGITGAPVDVQTPVPLGSGFNLLAYLPSFADLPGHSVGSVLPDVDRVLGFETLESNPSGGGVGGKLFNPALPDFINTLAVMAPGLGYWVKMNGANTLVFPAAADPATPAGDMAKSVASSSDDGHVWPTDQWMGMYGQLVVGGEAAGLGTTVEALDAAGNTAAWFEVHHPGLYGYVPVYLDNLDTDRDEGAERGEWLAIRVNGNVTDYRVQWTEFGDLVQLDMEVEHGAPSGLPAAFALQQNYPNPFNPGTTISYQLPRQVAVRMSIYNVGGQLIRELVKEEAQSAGRYSVTWDGLAQDGRPLASGIYICRLRAGRFEAVRKLLLAK